MSSPLHLAARYTDKIYDFEWIDHFAAARNFVFSKAEMDYILWLDADDMLTEKDREKLIELKNLIRITGRDFFRPVGRARISNHNLIRNVFDGIKTWTPTIC
jgi:hypothetical protein